MARKNLENFPENSKKSLKNLRENIIALSHGSKVKFTSKTPAQFYFATNDLAIFVTKFDKSRDTGVAALVCLPTAKLGKPTRGFTENNRLLLTFTDYSAFLRTVIASTVVGVP